MTPTLPHTKRGIAQIYFCVSNADHRAAVRFVEDGLEICLADIALRGVDLVSRYDAERAGRKFWLESVSPCVLSHDGDSGVLEAE